MGWLIISIFASPDSFIHVLGIKIAKIKYLLSETKSMDTLQLILVIRKHNGSWHLDCRVLPDQDGEGKIMCNRTETIFIAVITSPACLWLFQFPFAVSLMKPSLPNALYFGFLLFLAVLLTLLRSCWRGSVSTNCSKRQRDIHRHPTGSGRRHLNHLMALESAVGKQSGYTHSSEVLFSPHSSRFLITWELLRLHFLLANCLQVTSQFYFTQIWKPI